MQENRDHLLVISFTPANEAGSQDKRHTSETASGNGKGKVSETDEKIGNIAIKASPVWFDSYDYEDLVAFKMGVEFVEPLPRQDMSVLKKAMKAHMSSF